MAHLIFLSAGVVILNEIKFTAAIVGAVLSQWLGGIDGLIETLIVFVVVDYVTGIFAAIIEKKLSSEFGFKGLLRKVLIFVLVGIANIIDVKLLNVSDGPLRSAVIFFYVSNEGISILENVTRSGLPVPDKLKNILLQLKKGK